MLTEAQVLEIKAGCEGVTPGPWVAAGGWTDGGGRYNSIRTETYEEVVGEYGLGENDATYFARLDPATVTALCDLALAMLKQKEAGHG